MTLETVSFFWLDAVLRTAGLAADLPDADFGLAFLLLIAGLGVEEVFLADRSFAALRVGGFAALARCALGLEAFALTGRFDAGADARLAVEREVDRRKPFVRLLLMCGISMGAQLE